MHVFVVSTGVVAFFVAFVLVGAVIKLKKKLSAPERKATGTTIMDTETGKTRSVKPGDFI